MKPYLLLLAGISWCSIAAGALPVFTVQPTNQTALQGDTATFTVAATGAEKFQWRFNGDDLVGATNGTLVITNVQLANSGYYMALAQNSSGWVPSRLAYLAYAGTPAGSRGMVPFSNTGGNPVPDQCSFGLITNGTARVAAGPQLDQMETLPGTASVHNGFYSGAPQSVPTVAPGQTVYYRIEITHTCHGSSYVQPSTILKLVAGGDSFPVPSAGGLKFPTWPEWPEPWYVDYFSTSAATNQLRIPGESFSLTNNYLAYDDFGTPTAQWRKDGRDISGATNSTYYKFGSQFTTSFNATNMQASDAGTYDVVVLGNNWIIQPTIRISMQLADTQAFLVSPRISGSNFIADLQGVAGRKYYIQSSSNIVDWSNLLVLSNATGVVSFSNAVAPQNVRYYRARLVP